MERFLVRWVKERRKEGAKIGAPELKAKIKSKIQQIADHLYQLLLTKKYSETLLNDNPSFFTEETEEEEENEEPAQTEIPNATPNQDSEEEFTYSRKNYSQSHLSDEQEKILLKWIEDQYSSKNRISSKQLRDKATQLGREQDSSKPMFSTSWVTTI